MVTYTVVEIYQATSVPASSGAKVHCIVLGHCSLNVTLPSLLTGSSNIDVTGLGLKTDILVHLGSAWSNGTPANLRCVQEKLPVNSSPLVCSWRQSVVIDLMVAEVDSVAVTATPWFLLPLALAETPIVRVAEMS